MTWLTGTSTMRSIEPSGAWRTTQRAAPLGVPQIAFAIDHRAIGIAATLDTSANSVHSPTGRPVAGSVAHLHDLLGRRIGQIGGAAIGRKTGGVGDRDARFERASAHRRGSGRPSRPALRPRCGPWCRSRTRRTDARGCHWCASSGLSASMLVDAAHAAGDEVELLEAGFGGQHQRVVVDDGSGGDHFVEQPADRRSRRRQSTANSVCSLMSKKNSCWRPGCQIGPSPSCALASREEVGRSGSCGFSCIIGGNGGGGALGDLVRRPCRACRCRCPARSRRSRRRSTRRNCRGWRRPRHKAAFRAAAPPSSP